MVLDVFIPNVLCNKNIYDQVSYVLAVSLDDPLVPTSTKVSLSNFDKAAHNFAFGYFEKAKKNSISCNSFQNFAISFSL